MNRLLDSSFYFWSVYFNEEPFKEVGSDFRRIRVVKPVVELSLLHRISSPLSRCSVPFTFMLAALALFHHFVSMSHLLNMMWSTVTSRL